MYYLPDWSIGIFILDPQPFSFSTILDDKFLFPRVVCAMPTTNAFSKLIQSVDFY